MPPLLRTPCPTPHGPPLPGSSSAHADPGVHIAGLGRAGMALALLLADAGVRPLALWDPRPVGPDDLGTGFLPADLGRPRAAAAERRVRELHPDLRVFAHHGPAPLLMGALTVSFAPERVDADLVARALAAEHPVLPVVLREDGVTVGPWCVAGVAGCALCEAGGGVADAGIGRASSDHGPLEPDGPGGPAAVATPRVVEVETAPAGGGVMAALRAALAAAEEVLGIGHASVRERTLRPRPGCACAPEESLADLERRVAALGWDQAVGVPWSSSRTSAP